MSHKTVAVDFDGPIHQYSRGWQDGSIYDGPTPGAQEALRALLDMGYEVVIWSTRCADRVVDGEGFQPHQRREIELFLATHEIPYSRIHDEPGKPLCIALIDDRAIHFDGVWSKAIRAVQQLDAGEPISE